MNGICAVTRSETNHKSVSIVSQIQSKALFSPFSSKDLGSLEVS